MRVVKSMRFDAAHFLDDRPGDAPNADRPYARMHGHSFLMEVEVVGETDPEMGWVIDFGDVEDALNELRERLDHHLLNEIDGLERPTLENICRWAAKELRPSIPGLARVRVSRPSIGEAQHLRRY